LTNPVNMVYNGYTIETNTELAYEAPELSAWQAFWQDYGGWIGAAFGGLSGLILYGAEQAGWLNAKTSMIIQSGIDIAVGVALLFTPAVVYGVAMIGTGIGGIIGGYISEATGGNFALGYGLGSLIGGIVSGLVYKGVQYLRVVHFLKKAGVSGEKIRNTLSGFKGIPQIKKLKKDTVVYRSWGGASREIGPWVTPYDYGPYKISFLALPPENTMEYTSSFVIPAGTKYLFGMVAPNFNLAGGGIQWWLELWKIMGR